MHLSIILLITKLNSHHKENQTNIRPNNLLLVENQYKQSWKSYIQAVCRFIASTDSSMNLNVCTATERGINVQSQIILKENMFQLFLIVHCMSLFSYTYFNMNRVQKKGLIVWTQTTLCVLQKIASMVNNNMWYVFYFMKFFHIVYIFYDH